jgi:hypothetical protein
MGPEITAVVITSIITVAGGGAATLCTWMVTRKMRGKNGDDESPKSCSNGFRCSTVLGLSAQVASHQADIRHLLDSIEKMEKWVEGIHRRLDELASNRNV